MEIGKRCDHSNGNTKGAEVVSSVLFIHLYTGPASYFLGQSENENTGTLLQKLL